MAIKGLGSFDMMSAYNRIDIAERAASTVTPANEPAVSNAQTANTQQDEQQQPQLKVNLNLDGMRRRPVNLSFEDISRDFGRRDSFVITEASEEEMEKAVSDMQKDQSLQQFQYFVGDSKILVDDEDGLVFTK